MIRPFRGALLLLATACLAPAAATAQEPTEIARPTVGLVLSGGGARGLAHIGVLEVLEELRVPIDAITGTSMGAVVGGLYAAGLSAAEIRAILADVEWDRILAETPPRSALDAVRRAETRRYGVELEFGVSPAGLVLPSGLIAGQDLGLLLRRHTLPVATIEDFSRLPIPFTAVATDIATGERVLLDRGDLVEAMRASMAIPVVFSPIEREGRLLVDGGLVDNLPVELARQAGIEAVIAVDVTPSLQGREDLRDLLGITQQLVILLGRQDVGRQLALADVSLDLEMEDVGLFDFRAADSIMARGARIARGAAGELSRWSQSEAAYREHLAFRARRRPPLPPHPGGLRIEGPGWLDRRLALARVDPTAADTLDPDLLERAARAVYALGEFERVGYDLDDGTGGPPTIVLRPLPKPRGPHVVRLGVDLATDSARDGTAILSFQGAVGYARKRIGARAAEWRADLALGTRTGIETAFHQPLDFAGRWFVEPVVRAVEIQRPVFAGERIVGEYENRVLEATLDAGRAIGLTGEIRFGLAVGRATAELDDASGHADGFPHTGDDVAELRAVAVLDRVDAVNLPRRGVYARLETRASREELGADRTWTRVELDMRAYRSRGPHTVLAGLAGGGASPATSLPAREAFLLGGPGSLSGFADGELRGEAFVAARLGWLRRMAELPPALRAVLAGGWVEAGDAWHPARDESLDLRAAATAAIGAETLLGPVFVAVSRAGGGRGRLSVSLGRSP